MKSGRGEPRVLLLAMPWNRWDYPSIQVGLLKAYSAVHSRRGLGVGGHDATRPLGAEYPLVCVAQGGPAAIHSVAPRGKKPTAGSVHTQGTTPDTCHGGL